MRVESGIPHSGAAHLGLAVEAGDHRWSAHGAVSYVVAMRVTHLGHSCLLVELAEVRVLIDPGTLLHGVRGAARPRCRRRHPPARRPPRPGSGRRPAGGEPAGGGLRRPRVGAAALRTQHRRRHPVAGQTYRVGAATLAAVGALHAVNHAGVPRCTNVGVVLSADGEPSLYHPGDAYDGEPGDVDILAMPVNAPWAKVSESIDAVRRLGAAQHHPHPRRAAVTDRPCGPPRPHQPVRRRRPDRARPGRSRAPTAISPAAEGHPGPGRALPQRRFSRVIQ